MIPAICRGINPAILAPTLLKLYGPSSLLLCASAMLPAAPYQIKIFLMNSDSHVTVNVLPEEQEAGHANGDASHSAATCEVCEELERDKKAASFQQWLRSHTRAWKDFKAPYWWSKEFLHLRHEAARRLESRAAHITIIVLTLIDLCVILTDIVLADFYCEPLGAGALLSLSISLCMAARHPTPLRI
jgi:hypothetical protein